MLRCSRVDSLETDSVRSYYDDFIDHLLYDRLRLNPRHVVIGRLLRRYVPRGGSVLDLGCGIGITSEIARRRAARVVAVDLAPRLIEYAAKTVPSVQFEVGDIVSLRLAERFDVVCLFDVMEHVPTARWADLWETVEIHLAEQGRVIVTVPHPAATIETEEVNAGARQIIEEVVSPAELIAGAEKRGLVILEMRTYGVDREPEYLWAVLERLGRPAPKRRSRLIAPVETLRVRLRARRFWDAARQASAC